MPTDNCHGKSFATTTTATRKMSTIFVAVHLRASKCGGGEGVGGYQVLDMPPGIERRQRWQRRWLQNGKYEIYVVPP